MEKNLFFEKEPEFIQDLGSGFSNVHLDVKEVYVDVETDFDTHNTAQVSRWCANVQRVQNPVTYEKVVNAAIKDEFPNGEDEAALRKGIIDKNDKDFIRLNSFAEKVKQSYKDMAARHGVAVVSEEPVKKFAGF